LGALDRRREQRVVDHRDSEISDETPPSAGTQKAGLTQSPPGELAGRAATSSAVDECSMPESQFFYGSKPIFFR